MIEGASYGVMGEPVNTIFGCHRSTAAYDALDRRVRVRLFGVDGHPIEGFLGFHRDEREYGSDGQPLYTRYFNLRDTVVTAEADYLWERESSLEVAVIDASSDTIVTNLPCVLHQLRVSVSRTTP
jgi:hypothetical protein